MDRAIGFYEGNRFHYLNLLRRRILGVHERAGINQHRRNETDIALPRGIDYVVAQLQKHKVILVPDVRSAHGMLHNVPLLLNLARDRDRTYRLFDVYKVKKYRKLSTNGWQLPDQRFNTTRVSSCLDDKGKLKAHATAVKPWLIRQSPEVWLPGFVQYAPDSGERIDVVMRGADGSNPVPRPSFPVTDGSLVNVCAAVLREGELTFGNYVLPKEYEDEGGRVIRTEEYVPIRAENYAANDEHTLTSLGVGISNLNRFQIRTRTEKYEETVLASALFAQQRHTHACLKTRAEPEEILITITQDLEVWSGKLEFKVQKPFDRTVSAYRARLWEPAKVLRFDSANFVHGVDCESGLKATISEVILDDNQEIIALECLLDHAQTNLFREKFNVQRNEESKLFDLCVYLDPDNSGYEMAISQFQQRKISAALNDYDSIRGTILRQATGIERHQTPLNLPNEEIIIETADGIILLDEEQSQVINLLTRPECPILVQEAPAGTGKTLDAAVYLRHCLENTEGTIFAASITNIGAQNLAKTFFKLDPELERGTAVFLQSPSAEILSTVVEDKCWKSARVPELLSYWITETESETYQPSLATAQPLNPENSERNYSVNWSSMFWKTDCKDQKFVSKYLRNRQNPDGRHFQEDKAFKIFTDAKKPRIIFGTVAVISSFLNQLEVMGLEPNYLVLDEGGLVSQMNFLAFVSRMKNLQQVLLTGDSKTLPAYTGKLPENVVRYGHASALRAICKRRTVPTVTLKWSYRSHPAIAAVLSSVAYDDGLLPKLCQQERNKWTQLGFPGQHGNVPILLIHVPQGCIQTCWETWKNGIQVEIATSICAYIRKKEVQGTIAVLGYYMQAVRDIQISDENVKVRTIDSFTGSEADFVVLVTTRTGDTLEELEKYKFLFRTERAVAAWSRPKEGIFIIGDFSLLKQNNAWHNFIGDVANTYFEPNGEGAIVQFRDFLNWVQ